MERFAGGHQQGTLPDADQYIVQAFIALGLCISGGMGIVPLSWTEIDAFLRRSSYELDDFEAEIVFNMSRAYVSWLNKGADINCFSPWDDTSDTAKANHREWMQKQLEKRKAP